MLLVQDRNAEAATADERLRSVVGNRREAGLRRVEIEHEKRIHRRPNLRIVNSLSLNM